MVVVESVNRKQQHGELTTFYPSEFLFLLQSVGKSFLLRSSVVIYGMNEGWTEVLNWLGGVA